MLNIIHHFMNGKKLYEQYVEPLANEFHLTTMEFHIIMFLHNNPDHDTAIEIVKYRHFVKSQVSTSIKDLEKKGYLTTYYKDGNHRTIHLSLNSTCNSIILKGSKMQKEYIDNLTKDFSKEELDVLKDFFNRIDQNISDKLN